MAASGLPPKCAACSSLERHRVVRQVYDAIPDSILGRARVLQFSDDPASPKERFKSVEVSLFERHNSLDMTAIDRKDASYDWVIANHVLEHVYDDHLAIRELLRIVTDDGVVQLTVPTPSTALETWELAEPDPDSFDHWRGYGSDLPLRLAGDLKDCFGLQVVCRDEPTQGWDVVYLFTKSRQTMLTIGKALLKAGLPTLRAR
jgi:SAM-dependent methyltransferase